MDFIPKKSNVACVLQCGGLWFGGKGWGLTLKLVQCVVKPQEVVSVYGRCHIQLSDSDLQTIEKQESKPVADDDAEEEDEPAAAPVSTEVEDSDEEEEPEPVVVAAPVKKVVKKAPAPMVAAPEPEPEAEVAVAVEPPKKKVVKKKPVA